MTEVSGRKHIQCFDLVKLLKNGVLDGQPLQIPFRKNLADRPLENSPIAGPVEVIKNDKAPPVQILSKIGGFLRNDHPAAWFAEIDQGVVHDLRIIQPDNGKGLRRGLHGGQLGKNGQ